MIDIIDEDLFADVVSDCFDVLDRRYVANRCKQLLPMLQSRFVATFGISYIVLDRKTGKPVSVHALLDSYTSAKTMMRVLGDDEHEVGYLVRNK